MIHLSSDLHIWHTNVITYCSRPYETVEEMNEALVSNWNSVVKQEDEVYCLGDFSLGFRAVETFSSRLNGTKYLVPGNHDLAHSFNRKSRTEENRAKWIQKYEARGWKVLPEIYRLVVGDTHFRLCHHPCADDTEIGGDKYKNWRPFDDGTILLHGHVHEKFLTKRTPKGTLQINVGVDVWNYTPVSIDQILKLIEQENGKEK